MCFFQKTCEHEAKRKRKNKSNSKNTCGETCDKNAENNSGKNPTNEQSERQHFTKHASFCFASFRYSRIFLVFFFKFSATLWETSVQKVRNKNNAPKKQNNAKMSAKYTILRICYLSKTHFVRDILQKLQKLQVEVVKTKHSCKTPVIETGTSMTQRDLGLAMAAHVIMSVVDL